MIENLSSYLAGFPEHQRLNRLREYVQWLILKSIDEKGLRHKLAFVGGTALRVIFRTARFSEDLDFSVIRQDFPTASDFSCILQSEMSRCGLVSRVANLKSGRAVMSFFLKFPDLLYPLGISPNKTHLLSVKIEVDRNPPDGWHVGEYLFPDPVMFWVNHYDLPSLFAGKLHAFFFRGYDKGRDYYDLIYFLKNKVPVNLKLFQNAVKQTHPSERFANPDQIFSKVADKIRKTDMRKIQREVLPFLLDPAEERFLTAQTILKLMEQGKYLR